MRKIMNKRISYKMILILLIITLCLLLFPILLIGKYNVPTADDYSFGKGTHDVILNEGSLISVLEAFWNQMIKSYYKSQGTFSAVFLFSLQPAIWGEDYYALVPFIMLASLLAGVICFGFTFFRLFDTEKLTIDKKIEINVYAAFLSVFC